MRKHMTELDMLECAEYVLDLLGSKLDLSEFELSAEWWIERCKAECVMRRGQYLVVDEPIAPKGEEDE